MDLTIFPNTGDGLRPRTDCKKSIKGPNKSACVKQMILWTLVILRLSIVFMKQRASTKSDMVPHMFVLVSLAGSRSKLRFKRRALSACCFVTDWKFDTLKRGKKLKSIPLANPTCLS